MFVSVGMAHDLTHVETIADDKANEDAAGKLKLIAFLLMSEERKQNTNLKKNPKFSCTLPAHYRS